MKTKSILLITCAVLFAFNATSQTTDKTNAFVDPKVTVAGKTGGNITVEEFLSDSILHIFPAKENLEVVTFKMSFLGTEIKYTEMEGRGNKITEEMQSMIKTLKPGNKVFIEFIKARKSDSTDPNTRSLHPVSLTIIAK